MTKAASARRLTAVSGFDELPPADFSKADYTLVQDFADLAATLRRIANDLCKASVTVTKVVDEGDGVYRPDPGWQFTGTVSTSPGSYTWLQPSGDPPTGPRTQTTDVNGVATFQWDTSNSLATSTFALDEALKPGYDFVDVKCTSGGSDSSWAHDRQQTTEPIANLSLRPNEYYKCTVRNRIRPGTIEIEKQATPQGSQGFQFTGSLPPFTLVDAAGGSASSRTFTGLVPGTYTVRELVPANWQLTGVTCTPAGAAAITGAEVAITLAAGGSVVCTYRDRRDDTPPTPPTPPTPRRRRRRHRRHPRRRTPPTPPALDRAYG